MLRPILGLATLALALTLFSPSSFAESCEAIRAQIDAKVRAGGVQQFTLTTVDAGATAPGKVVGSCDRGTKKIVYAAGGRSGAAATGSATTPSAAPVSTRPAPAKKGTQAILTECKDGTVSMGGDCKK